MAYVPRPEDEEDQEGQPGGQPSLLGGGRQSAGPSRGEFTNVTEYLDKNPNEGQNLADMAGDRLTAQRDEASQAVQQAGQSFGQRVQEGSSQFDEDLVGRATSSPESFVQNPDDVSRFTALRDAAYKGPSNLEETDLFAPAQSKVNALKSTAESIGTEAGRNQIISPLSSRPSAGKTALNQLLLQGNPDSAQQLKAVADTFPGVEDQWNQVRSQAGQNAQTARTGTDEARTKTRAALDTAKTGFTSGLDQKLASKTSERDAFNLGYDQILSDLLDKGGMNLRADQLQSIGAQDAYPYLSKLNSFNQDLTRWGNPTPLSSYVNVGAANSNIPTRESVAGAEDYAREAALQQLSGQDLGLPPEMVAAYIANGKMPTMDYMGAFNTAGSKLQGLDADILANPANFYPVGPGASTDDFYSRFLTAKAHAGTPDYYTSPDATATPQTLNLAPAPEGWDPNSPPPYPVPTSEPPQGMVAERWNPYTGQWEGAMLQPGNPPPTPPTGGGNHFFSRGV